MALLGFNGGGAWFGTLAERAVGCPGEDFMGGPQEANSIYWSIENAFINVWTVARNAPLRELNILVVFKGDSPPLDVYIPTKSVFDEYIKY